MFQIGRSTIDEVKALINHEVQPNLDTLRPKTNQKP